ncbi:DinB family protein [Deinococcus arcticus]|uniref:Damage-inducible protein DinB n=1 Tax=Deinococcus arcticus TaxID=2136176 RepID=A0A2T3WA39_9DEIO|nr:DinB family protein [Deinococcus arcticus]PTA68766.1 damage-inducible protein DinB [Deinococcus arcticus]
MLGAALAAHWLGHHHLTARTLALYPDEALLTFSPAPPLRSFGAMLWEVHGQTGYVLQGLRSGIWGEPRWSAPTGRDPAALRAAWAAQTAQLARELPGVPDAAYLGAHRTGWGELSGLDAALGAVDNQVHHRAQGYVYLRALGLEPPEFWDRTPPPAFSGE